MASHKKPYESRKGYRPGRQPLASKTYAFMSLIALLISVGILMLYIYVVPLLVRYGVEPRFYFVLLVVLGAGAALLMFGAMRSYAAYRGEKVPGNLDLGGPVVAFALCVVGGLSLTASPESFNVTVRLRDRDGNAVGWGTVFLRLGPDTRTAQVTPVGEADFKEIPASYRNTEADISVHVEGYELAAQAPKTLSRVIVLRLSKVTNAGAGAKPSDTLNVTVWSIGPRGEAVRGGAVSLDLGPYTLTSPISEDGRARFEGIPLKFLDSLVKVEVECDGYKLPDRQRRVRLADPIVLLLSEAGREPRGFRKPHEGTRPETGRQEPVESRAGSPPPTPPPTTPPVKGCTAEEIRLKRC